MVTNNAINTGKPIEVANGGTGLATLTAHALYVGNGASAPTALSVGTTGQLLVGVTGLDPAFASSATGDFTFTSATAGATRTLTVSNTDNTNASSTALIKASTGGASAGDAQFQASTTTTTWTWGADNSVTSPTADPFVIAQGTALGTNNVMSVATSGEINYPLQPSFFAYNSADDTNVTGDGTGYLVICDTEVYDQNGDYDNGTGIFTAPVTGRYLFCITVQAANIGASHTTGFLQLGASNRTPIGPRNSPAAVKNAANVMAYTMTTFIDMDAADVADAIINIAGSTKTITVTGNSIPNTYFSGQLLA